MCKQHARSSLSANIRTQNVLVHSEGVSKVTAQKKARKIALPVVISHNFFHHKSMQVNLFLSMVCVTYGWLSGQESCLAVICFAWAFSFAFWIHRKYKCVGEDRSWMHILLANRCEQSSFLIIGYFMDTDSPCCCQGLQSEARQPSTVFPTRPLS